MQQQQERKGQMTNNNLDFNKTKVKIEQLMKHGMKPEQLIKYLLPSDIPKDHLALTRDQYFELKDSQDLEQLLEKNTFQILQQMRRSGIQFKDRPNISLRDLWRLKYPEESFPAHLDKNEFVSP